MSQTCRSAALASVFVLLTAGVPRQAAGAAQKTGITPAETIQKYCITCHNDRLKTAGLTLASLDIQHPTAQPEIWEKVIRKLRTRAMPPATAPRPDTETYDALATYLETSIDRDAFAAARPGKLALIHRLSRTEYQNAIRDLLAIDALPQEIDYPLLLPADNAASGFDNLADLLFMSPTIMERYLDAAEKISRLAVGDTHAPVLVNRYRLHPEQWQDARVDELPWGTRGGLSAKSDFPADGEYAIKVDVVVPQADTHQEPVGGPVQTHQLEISVDGTRVAITPVGQPQRGRGRAPTGPFEFKVPITAGPHLLGVTFVARDEVRDELTLRPRMRGRGPEPAVSLVTISGPYGAKSAGDSPSRRRIFSCGTRDTACAKQILLSLTRRAYRRPTTDADIQDLLPFYEKGRVESGFDMGIERALERLLVSPQFLFRVEREPADVESGRTFRITDVELASRLSFFLWSSIPDEELLNLAAQGQLHSPPVLEREIQRMLRDERSRSLVTNFAEQWLFVRDIEAKQPDGLLFPDFDESLRTAMHKETDLFLDSVLRGNRSILDLLTADYSFLNERLAKHYGIPNVHGSNFRKVTFPSGSPRGGLLGQGSILTLTSYATRTSPVVRGKWVLENLLSAAPPPPPPNIPALKTDGPEPGKMVTMREAMTRHRANPSCAGCHARMDPIGFAMENFDAVGRWRDHDNGSGIDVSGSFPDGTTFNGMPGLKQILLGQKEQFINTVAEKLLMYALGRNLQYYDQPWVRRIVHESAASNYTFSSLVACVVNSVPFEFRTRS